MNILETLEKKQKKPEQLVDKVMGDKKLLATVFSGTSSPKANVKYGSTKILRSISEQRPEMLYSQMDFFIDLLDNDNQILKWNAMDIIGNMVMVDSENKFDKIFDEYYGLINDDVMITAGHVIDNSAKIAAAKPQLQDKITKNLLKVEKIPRDQECKNILMGKTILAFNSCFEQINEKDRAKVISFVKRQLNNSRNATKNKAEKFLKRVEKKGRK